MHFLSSVVYAAPVIPPPAGQSITWQSCSVNEVPTLQCLELIFGRILSLSSAFIVLVLFIMFIVGGFNYLTSFGNPEKIKKAQGTLKYAIYGLVLFVSSYLIIRIIGLLFLADPTSLFHFSIPGPGGP